MSWLGYRESEKLQELLELRAKMFGEIEARILKDNNDKAMNVIRTKVELLASL